MLQSSFSLPIRSQLAQVIGFSPKRGEGVLGSNQGLFGTQSYALLAVPLALQISIFLKHQVTETL